MTLEELRTQLRTFGENETGDVLDVDLALSAQRKIEDNNRRYPVSRVRGRADKQS